MALFRKQSRPKGFTRKPIYWDPEKEERELRERQIRTELGIETDNKYHPETYRPDIKGKFRSAAHGDRDQLRDIRKKNIRKMLLFIATLIVLLYLILTALPFLEQFLENFVK